MPQCKKIIAKERRHKAHQTLFRFLMSSNVPDGDIGSISKHRAWERYYEERSAADIMERNCQCIDCVSERVFIAIDVGE